MKRFVEMLSVALLFLLVAGCSDPADKVYKSSASAPAKTDEATKSPVSGKEYVIRADGSTIEFVGSKVTGSHDGGFKNFAGTLNIANGKIVGPPVIKINMKSIWADNEKLTGHLKSADFFEVEKYPVSTFTVTSLEPALADKNDTAESGSRNTTVTGNLDMHGVIKSISFPAQIDVSENEVTVAAEFAINRKDFNINNPGKQDDLIRDNVVLKLSIKATPGEAKPEDQLAN